ncbi:hypothetical protein ATY77_30705 [Rhizobium sp. R634]|nr:hypothetical protein ATY77_30705 [Rhizobium sp. R634]
MEIGEDFIVTRRAAALVVIAGAVLLAAGGGRADDIPFFASRDVPDYKASMVIRETWFEVKTFARTVLHHKGWTKVEEVKTPVTTVAYGNYFDNPFLLWLAKSEDDEDFATAIIEKVTPPEAKDTGVVRVKAGEVCHWWELSEKAETEDRVQPPWRSCLSRDGIEVATSQPFGEMTANDGTDLVKLERGPVAESDVRPPKRIFEPAFWLKPRRDYPERPADRADFDVRMKTADGRTEIRLLRHYPWRLEDRRGPDGAVQFKVWNELENQGMAVSTVDDLHRFEARRSPRASSYPYTAFDKTFERVDMNLPSSSHRGEDCTWFDMKPDILRPAVKNVLRAECVTRDGMPLKLIGRDASGAIETFAAVEVERRPVDIKEMMPPRELIDPSLWGFTIGD